MRISMSPTFAKKAALTMFLTALVLTLVSFTALLGREPLAQFISARSSLDIPAARDLMMSDVAGIVNVDYEANIPTWFSTSVLLVNSILLVAISLAKKAVGDRYVPQWWGLSVIFLLLSLDELAQVHDRVNFLLSPALGTSGIFTFFWVIPWSIFVLLVGLVYLRFLFALPTRVKWLFLAAAGLYVGGALGGEMTLGYMASEGYVDREDYLGTLSWLLEVHIEEFLEMTGAIIFFYALTGYFQDTPREKTNT